MGAFEDYRRSVNESRAWFVRQHGAVVRSFEVLNTGFDELGRCLQLGRDAAGKSHISLAPLLMISQRQAFVALDALSSRQAYQAWVLLRPGIESALFMGKWMDDLENYRRWVHKAADPGAYQRAYSGKALASRALPRSDDLQRALKTVNDLFVHPNPDYYARHTHVAEVDDGSLVVRFEFFDDDAFHWASVLAMVHLLITLQDALAQMFAARFPNVDVRPDGYGLAGFEAAHHEAAIKAATAGPTEANVIHAIGLWPTPNA